MALPHATGAPTGRCDAAGGDQPGNAAVRVARVSRSPRVRRGGRGRPGEGTLAAAARGAGDHAHDRHGACRRRGRRRM